MTDENEVAAVEAALMEVEQSEAVVETKPEVDTSDHILPDKTDDSVVAAAQQDLLQSDVLVCGKCHNVYHFIDSFSEHKNSGQCDGQKQVLSTISDAKSQVWAFFLWKAARTKDEGNTKEGSHEWANNSWNLYQRWCKIPQEIRKTWLDAGKTLQELATLGSAAFNRKQVLKQKQISTQQLQQQQKTLMELQKELEDDETEMMSTLGLTATNKSGGGVTDTANKASVNRVLRKSFKPKADEDGLTSEEEYMVEKIVAKRVNPKTKQPEYLLKWEGFPSDQNTWESLTNLSTCTKLVQEFEKNLARQKAKKALEANKNKNVIRLEDIVQATTPTSTRPVRNSAKRALDQVKEWVNISNKRRYESDEDSEEDVKQKKQENGGIESLLKKKVIGGSKTPVLVANSKGVVRVDPSQVPNLSSGVYILSSQSGLIKVDDPTALKLTEAMKNEGKKFSDALNPKVMINETEIRKIPAKNKVNLLKREQSGVMKKDSVLSPSVKIIQKSSMNRLPVPLRFSTPKLSDQLKLVTGKGTQKQILLGAKKPSPIRPLPGPIQSPLRPPILKPRVTIKPASAKRNTVQQIKLTGGPGGRKETITIEKFSDEDFDGGLPDEFPKADDPIAPPSPSRPLTLCPLTGEVLGRAEGEKTPPPDQQQDECILSDFTGAGDDEMLRVEMSPGGTIRQIVTSKPTQQVRKQTGVQRKQQRKTPVETPVMMDADSEQEFISIEGEDGIIYQITPEQQQLLLNNGTLTVDGRIVQQDEDVDTERTEIVIQNGQLIQRIVHNEDEISQDGSTILMQGDEQGEGQIILQEGELTLDQAVQEAVSNENESTSAAGETDAAEFYQDGDVSAAGEDGDAAGQEDNQQMVAQIVQAEPPTPGGGPRKVVLLLPDGSLIHTEMDEDQYQALEFEK